ncbi:TPR repeat-contatining protein [Paramagnetospirillum magnetotacticum MS-1]|uniref:TPR repeat-contatining protein n=1 Tax=Paramagnetospirillum magnetotacticum MS-1 TaxID=272627 RepID=A0A0C2YZU2_PARME|nr:CHAT domain-containing tetratricopeptide repeat protein [Paramagnetospirillum magnetotacticum]KIM00156.1 TPR repeat-contatining protein [Paramagnetospirillum magnetotacticum MS-1]
MGIRLAIIAAFLLPAFAALAEGVPLGKDLLGQECRGEVRAAISPDARVPPPMDVYCGPSALAGGRVRADWAGAESVEQALAASPVAADTASRLACQPARPERGQMVAACMSREGGWPAITLATLRGPLLLQAEGTPANQPALEAAMAHLAPLSDGAASAPAAARPDGLYDSSLAASYRDLTELARLNNGMGNHAGAEQAYRRALDVQRKVFGDNDPGLGDTLMHLALEVSNQGRFVEAAELFRRAEPLVRKSITPLDMPRLISYQALDAANRHSFAEARALAHQASLLRQTLMASEGGGQVAKGVLMDAFLARGELAQSLLVEASMSLRLDDVASAAVTAAEALSITGDSNNLPGGWRVQALSTMGLVLGRQGRYSEGEALLNEAVGLSQRLFGDGMPTVLAWAALGRFRAEQGRYTQAMQAFRQEFALLARHSAEGMRLGFEAASPFIVTALELAEQGGEERDVLLDQVFSVLQLVQAGQQSDMVSHAALKFASGDERIAKMVAERQDSQRRRDEIRLSLASEAALPDDQRNGDREAWLADEYRFAVARMAELDGQLRSAFPDYANLSSPAPVTIARLRSALGAGEGVIAFAFGDDFGLAVMVTPDRVEAKRLDITREDLAAEVSELRKGITVQDGRVGRYDLGRAHALYAKLFAPLSPPLGALRHLLVIPAGALASLPAAALVVTPPSSNDPGRADWLARHSALSQWPSVGALVTMRRHAGKSLASLPLLGIGNPSFGGMGPKGSASLVQHCRSDGPLPAGLLGQLAPLPDTEVELRSVAKVLNASGDDILVGGGATEAALRAKSLDRYRVLYFATHGLLPAELRCQSEPGLALAPPAGGAATKAGDGLLEASEIAALRLDADLVVLSACNTASAGGGFGGEALSSLADVFFHAGARSVLASHWPVPSVSTTRLMTGLFEINAKAEGLDTALQQAQLALLANEGTAHPVHWAGFSLIGGVKP